MKRWLANILLVAIVLTPLSTKPVNAGWNSDGSGQAVQAISQQAAPAVLAEASAMLAEEGSAIYLRGVTIHPETGEPPLSPSLTQPAPENEGFQIVQFSGPIQPEWLTGLQDAGLKIVAYLPDYAYLVWGEQPALRIQQNADRLSTIHWSGAYHPYYRLAPELREAAERAAGLETSEFADVTVQFYNTSLLKDSLERVTSLAGEVYQDPTTVLNLTNIRLRVPQSALAEIASWSDVVNVEPYQKPEMLDEIQGQILAGNVRMEGGNLVPTGPGYLAWLDQKGLPKDPSAYPIVDLVDDGLDSGNAAQILHPDFFVQGSSTAQDRVINITNCTPDPSAISFGGHGSLNAGIVAGYNNRANFPYTDASGYRFGLGISPYGRISGTKIFANGGWFDNSLCGSSFAAMVFKAYENGSRITSNSWGAPSGGGYTADSQMYDILTRDAFSSDGNQEMLHIFAAGNAGPDPQTVNSPGSAKNVLTVGAAENVREHSVSDGCFMAEGDDAGDIAPFSSRGPALDGRVKPDILAPGTHIQSIATQGDQFDGSGVCGGVPTSTGFSPYYPLGQTLYTWSSGTSHSTPAVSGMAQILYTYYGRVLQPGKTPSPAMLKALILNTPRYMQGTDANDTLPSPDQGWGSADLGMALDGTPRILIDQTQILRSSGDKYGMVGQVIDPSKPLHISLVWTDAPASPGAGKAAVNNLNLEVTIHGQTYKGNVFEGAYTAGGGTADSLNNVESIFLPAGTGGSFQLRVTAHNLAGDGVPGNSTATDQDFALVIYNAEEVQAPVLAAEQTDWTEIHGNGNAAIDPGETVGLNITLENQGSAPLTQVTATLGSSDSRIVLINPVSTYADIPPGSAKANLQPYRIKIQPDAPCNQPIPLTLQINSPTFQDSLTLPPLMVGESVAREYISPAAPVDIPDFDSVNRTRGEVELPIAVGDTFEPGDLDVFVDIRHTWVSDLHLLLISPKGTSIHLSSGNGGMGDNYQGTTFDDQAEQSITAGLPPFSGHFRPEEPILPLYQEGIAGEWILKVQDAGFRDTGEILTASIQTKETQCSPYNPTMELQIVQDAYLYSTEPGKIVSFLVQIKNLGDTQDTFNITTEGPWQTNLPDSVGPVAPRQGETFEVKIEVPPDVPLWERNQVILTASSSNNPQDSVDIVMIIQTGFSYFMPTMRR